MTHMHANKSQRSKITRTLNVEDLETRTVMASDLAAALQAFVTASSRQQPTAAQTVTLSSNAGGNFAFNSRANASAGSDIASFGFKTRGDSSLQSNVTFNTRPSSFAGFVARGTGSLSVNNGGNVLTTPSDVPASDIDGAGNGGTSGLSDFQLSANRIATGQRPLSDRLTDFSLTADRIATGQRSLSDRLAGTPAVGSSVTFGNSVGTSLNGDVNTRTVRDLIFGSSFGARLNSNSQTAVNTGANQLSSSGRTSSGWVVVGTDTHPENPTPQDRLFLSRAGSVAARDAVFGSEFGSSSNGGSDVSSRSLSSGRTSSGWVVVGTDTHPENPTPADRRFLSRA